MQFKLLMLILAPLAVAPAHTQKPDGLILPQGFTATVVTSGLDGVRHMAVSDTGNLYLSTRAAGKDAHRGIIALEIGRDGRVTRTERFGDVSNGTGIRIHRGSLYASTPSSVVRYRMTRGTLVPAAAPETIVDGMPAMGSANRPITFDEHGRLYVAVGAVGNYCAPPPTVNGTKPVGSMPCPELATRAGIWRFDANRSGQVFGRDGERIATGVRDMDALDRRPGDAVYALPHGRNAMSTTWPDLFTADDDDAIGEEMHRVVPGTDFGWPYTFYDAKRGLRLKSPEYGGDNRTAPVISYSTPVITLPAHSAPLDLLFYNGRQFPRAYRGGAFITLHGANGPGRPSGLNGYMVVFVPFDAKGKAGPWQVFADGFAGPTPASRSIANATYRPTGLAMAPDGALYISDSVHGRIWRIIYNGVR